MKKSNKYWPMYLENLWSQSIEASSFYSDKGFKVLAEVYSKNADAIFNAQWVIAEAINNAN